MDWFLSKEFDSYGLGVAEYRRCEDCGFVASKTHMDMAPEEWERINRAFHAAYQGGEFNPIDPKWTARIGRQARMLSDVQGVGLLNQHGRWLDYACGDGKLSSILRAEYGLNLLNYERYMPKRDGYIDESELVAGSFDFVITTSVFEHFTRREQFDFVESLVSPRGVLGIHTLVCENVPADPEWFYLYPVHCAFHTNKSMEALFRQWNYTCSVYDVDAQLWLWFQQDAGAVEAAIERANSRGDGTAYIFKRGFVDYWKCLPYRVGPHGV